MSAPIRILLQTSIVPTENDWHIGRFSRLADLLAGERDRNGDPVFLVAARDRDPLGSADPVLSTLDTSPFDELWLFAVDTGEGLDDADRAGIDRFRRRGGGLMLTRDHMDLGCSICALPGVGAAHLFHTHNVDPGRPVAEPDDKGTPEILWPNFHSGLNGDFQEIEPSEPVHPILSGGRANSDIIRYLPAHPHEGAVASPAGDRSARVIATGTSKTTGNRFNVAVAFEASSHGGRAVAQSTFHHFADYNWDPASGAPDFVSEPPGSSILEHPTALAATHAYARNLALWLAGRLSPV
ncbi:hypothetical protein SAMIE_1004830 [Sphingobium amiense]|uniref:ThuA-like domain-containing protein n=1 Tax=Sphingobium amiense TaxID=135719 RepID=A0A494W9B3_9SPHN|nr:hypothetical protein [Sphingobium amiense]BBD96982.1 hypothetical protein SAMIE_1004830 [Sphingobium amiense]